MISESVWNIGGNAYSNPDTPPYGLPLLVQYTKERGTITYQNSQPSVWTGKVGLIYLSDYGYASTNSECRENLRAGITYNIETNSYSEKNALCKVGNWLTKEFNYQTISSTYISGSSIFLVFKDGGITYDSSYEIRYVLPSVYLKSNINIISGNGSKSNPYKLN